MPYIFALSGFSLHHLFHRGMTVGVGIALMTGTFGIFSHHYIGQYGLQRNIDSIYQLILEQKHLER